MKLQAYTQSLNAVKISRLASLIGGGTLISYSLLRRSKATLPLAVLGGGLVYNALNRNRGNTEVMEMGEKGTPTSASVQYGKGICVEKSVTISNKSPEELYQWWRNLENLPTAMDYLESVTMLDDKRSHWVAKAPAGTTVEWDAEIINEIPNELIAWRSVNDADVPNAGSVHFEPSPNGRGTVVKVELEYEPPSGKVGAAFAKLLGREPAQTVYTALMRFKQLMETGTTITVEGQSRGSRNPLSKFTE